MRRLCALLLCTALMFPSASALSDPVWPQWAEPALSWGQEAGISQSFLSAPEQVVTRGMAAQLLYESAGRPAVSEACPFSDVSGDYADAVTWAAGQGCLTGVGNGRYEPERPVTRQEFAAILWRRAACPAAPVQGLDAFSDAGATAEWARSAMLWCLQTDVMRGRSGGLLAPHSKNV